MPMYCIDKFNLKQMYQMQSKIISKLCFVKQHFTYEEFKIKTWNLFFF